MWLPQEIRVGRAGRAVWGAPVRRQVAARHGESVGGGDGRYGHARRRQASCTEAVVVAEAGVLALGGLVSLIPAGRDTATAAQPRAWPARLLVVAPDLAATTGARVRANGDDTARTRAPVVAVCAEALAARTASSGLGFYPEGV
jgi:hypothetical protein